VAVLSTPVSTVETVMANTINTRTRLNVEGALLPKSVRFESEPWTVFYRAGEVIRELRKASENKRVPVPPSKNDMRKEA
jgi:hypothetical protein